LYEEFTAVWNDLIVLLARKFCLHFFREKDIYMRFIFHFFIMNFDLPIESITLLEEKGCKI